MYYYVITVSCYNAAMKYFCSVEEEFPFPWGILPILKGLRFERMHMEGNIIFIDNRKIQMLSSPPVFPESLFILLRFEDPGDGVITFC